MSLVENLISQISTQVLGGITKPQGFDMSDDSFEKLLQDKLGGINVTNQTQDIPNLGAPAGFIIEPLDAPQTVSEVKPIETGEVQIKDINLDDFFTNVIKTQSTDNKGIFDLAKKHAANAYNTFAGKYVADLKDFISDAMALS